MFANILKFFKKIGKSEESEPKSKNMAKERLHLVLMQDRANVSADFLELMKQEIIDVIKKYIEVEEEAIDVRLTNEMNEDGTTGAPSLYANIPIINIRNEMKKEVTTETEKVKKSAESVETPESTNKVEEPKEKEDKKNEENKEQEENQKETKKEESKGKIEIKEEAKQSIQVDKKEIEEEEKNQ